MGNKCILVFTAVYKMSSRPEIMVAREQVGVLTSSVLDLYRVPFSGTLTVKK